MDFTPKRAVRRCRSPYDAERLTHIKSKSSRKRLLSFDEIFKSPEVSKPAEEELARIVITDDRACEFELEGEVYRVRDVGAFSALLAEAAGGSLPSKLRPQVLPFHSPLKASKQAGERAVGITVCRAPSGALKFDFEGQVYRVKDEAAFASLLCQASTRRSTAALVRQQRMRKALPCEAMAEQVILQTPPPRKKARFEMAEERRIFWRDPALHEEWGCRWTDLSLADEVTLSAGGSLRAK